MIAPAVAVTAYGRQEDRDRVLAAGFQLHISKPIDPAVFLDTIRTVVARDAAST